MLLDTLGHSFRNRVIRFNFHRSGETVSRYFKAALHAVGELRNEFIKSLPPETPYKIKSSNRFMPFFNDCISVIDETHIKARVPKENEVAFRERKPSLTQNVLAAVDFDLRITYVLAGWEGSAHDAAVLKNALERSDGLRVPAGKYYLADGGYSTRNGFISTYRATRYHLKEFSSIQPTNSNELFNLQHSSLCTTVERAFGSLKNHFTIIKCEPYFPLQTQVEIVIVCCILHNWIVTEGGDEFIQSEDEWARRSHFRSRDQAAVEDSREWLDKRDEIAQFMWTRMQNYGY
ncbi:protein ALP1-like [Dendrobium catenatum]|uniref:protein ALP1-like n=1 Tax=Dendrobium catenatum TaxID=906689 RepID=UPI0009F3141F|nr:protein ALP1-like [Dendrobium catenatum]